MKKFNFLPEMEMGKRKCQNKHELINSNINYPFTLTKEEPCVAEV